MGIFLNRITKLDGISHCVRNDISELLFSKLFNVYTYQGQKSKK